MRIWISTKKALKSQAQFTTIQVSAMSKKGRKVPFLRPFLETIVVTFLFFSRISSNQGPWVECTHMLHSMDAAQPVDGLEID